MGKDLHSSGLKAGAAFMVEKRLFVVKREGNNEKGGGKQRQNEKEREKRKPARNEGKRNYSSGKGRSNVIEHLVCAKSDGRRQQGKEMRNEQAPKQEAWKSKEGSGKNKMKRGLR